MDFKRPEYVATIGTKTTTTQQHTIDKQMNVYTRRANRNNIVLAPDARKTNKTTQNRVKIYIIDN